MQCKDGAGAKQSDAPLKAKKDADTIEVASSPESALPYVQAPSASTSAVSKESSSTLAAAQVPISAPQSPAVDPLVLLDRLHLFASLFTNAASLQQPSCQCASGLN